MSSRIFQSIVVQLKEATDRQLGVIDSQGAVTATSDFSLMGTVPVAPESILAAAEDNMAAVEGRTFRLAGRSADSFDYAVFVDGDDTVAASLCMMASVAIAEAKSYYEEKYDRPSFVKNILTDNILPGDIYIHARELHITDDVPWAVFLVRQVGSSEMALLNMLRRLCPDKQKDLILSINATDVAVVRELRTGTDAKDLQKMAASIQQAVQSELNIKTVIGIGTIARRLRELADSYKEAQVAIDVGKVFSPEETIINYDSLGIGRLIYQLPTTICEMFLREVFKKNPIDSLDEETLKIINKFFENNLNISETSRKLFVHRNTLVYRLGKIKKLTGLDLREFDQAVVFKVALMVKRYLDSRKA